VRRISLKGVTHTATVDDNATVIFQRFTGEVKNVLGLEAYRFGFPNNSLDNGKVIPENKCFCRNGNCLPEGIIDVRDCYYGEYRTRRVTFRWSSPFDGHEILVVSGKSITDPEVRLRPDPTSAPEPAVRSTQY
jgi:hypothetical protein